jgi:CheY-like chemotaxis protein
MKRNGGGLVLVVDDDEDIRELLKVFLEADGYQVNTAADGLEAWEQISDGHAPDLILLDLMMPRMDGKQFLKKLRQSRSKRLAVVILSANAGKREAKELDADCCLTKPVEIDELLDTVRHFMTAAK